MQAEIFNNASILEDLPHGKHELCPVLCEEPWVSDPRHQTSAGADCDFSAGSCQEDSNSLPRSLSPTFDSYSSPGPYDEFINSPPRSLPPRFPTLELPPPSPQPSTQSSNTDTFSSTSPSPPVEAYLLRCDQCQLEFPSVYFILRHVEERHRVTGSPYWPCLEPSCGLRFKHGKDLCRHLEDQHLDIKYTCACGHRARLDKHLRHVRDFEHKCQPVGPYICRCGAKTDSDTPTSLDDHLRHVREVIFTCSCGQRNNVADHLNHLDYQQCRGGSSYVCRCGNTTNSHTTTGLEEHRRHIEEDCPHGTSCGPSGKPRKRGRPRKMNNEST